MTKPLYGKAAIVTGASSGIGKATAVALAREGANVCLTGRRVERLNELVNLIEKSGVKAVALPGDVSDAQQIQQITTKARSALGHIDILVNSAGLMLPGPVVGADVNEWRRMVDVNLMGLMYFTHAVLPMMLEQNSGHIVNVSATGGRTAAAGFAVYCATKWAVGSFSECLRREVHTKNIRITVVEPGATDTELSDHVTHAQTKSAIKSYIGSLKQLEANDVARAIVYAITQPLHVDVSEILIRPIAQEM
jgi:NADP-dependent 3-hydroxy acid dehydrogenase YdfG